MRGVTAACSVVRAREEEEVGQRKKRKKGKRRERGFSMVVVWHKMRSAPCRRRKEDDRADTHGGEHCIDARGREHRIVAHGGEHCCRTWRAAIVEGVLTFGIAFEG
ncbi:hypothetical protein HN51_055111 [Arachis hypogaea]